jgi:hypothetical protein
MARHDKLYCMKGNRVSGPEGSVDIFLSILRKEFVGQIETETNFYAQRCENSKGNLFFKRSKMNKWKLVTDDKIM